MHVALQISTKEIFHRLRWNEAVAVAGLACYCLVTHDNASTSFAIFTFLRSQESAMESADLFEPN